MNSEVRHSIMNHIHRYQHQRRLNNGGTHPNPSAKNLYWRSSNHHHRHSSASTNNTTTTNFRESNSANSRRSHQHFTFTKMASADANGGGGDVLREPLTRGSNTLPTMHNKKKKGLRVANENGSTPPRSKRFRLVFCELIFFLLFFLFFILFFYR